MSRLDTDGHLHQDVRIRGAFKSLGEVKKIYGHLNLDNETLQDLGELTYLKSHFWLHLENSKLTTLGNLERVGGDLILNGSNIEELGKLQRVGGKVNLRDTNILNLGSLRYVGGDLFLPNRLKGVDLNNIEIKGKVRFWKDKGLSKLEVLKNTFDWEWNDYFSEIHSKELESKKRFLTGKYLVKRCFEPSEYNDYIIQNFDDFVLFVDSEIEKLYGEKYSFYDTLYNEIISVIEINNEFPKIKVDRRIDRSLRFKKLKNISNEFLSKNKGSNPVKKYESVKREFKKDEDWNGKVSRIWLRYDEHKLDKSERSCKFEWDPYKGQNIFEDGFIYFIENSILETFSVMIDSLQNKFRVQRGLPKIGEGWVQETDLYYKLKEHFSNTKVVHHGKPRWLGRQHIDIWFPKFKIGVEFQGIQHDEPVEFFGGDVGYKKNKERDKRKRLLFDENQSTLIEVRPGYNIDKVIEEIEVVINKKTN